MVILHSYLIKSGELIEGIAELDTYANQISQSVDKLYKDGVVYIDGKLAELSSGLSTLSGNSAQLNAGPNRYMIHFWALLRHSLRQQVLMHSELRFRHLP